MVANGFTTENKDEKLAANSPRLPINTAENGIISVKNSSIGLQRYGPFLEFKGDVFTSYKA